MGVPDEASSTASVHQDIQFVAPKDSLPCSQEPVQSGPYPYTFFFFTKLRGLVGGISASYSGDPQFKSRLENRLF